MSENNQTWRQRILYTTQTDDRSRMRAVANNLILHLHPTKVPAPALRWTYTWGLGGLSATLALLLIITGVILTFRYDASLSKAENRELARAFMQQAQRGDFFQMRANYYYGIGAHSMVFTEDYNAQDDTVTWTDSNMKGKKVDGKRYGYIQFDAVKEIDWFVDAFARKGYGATIYRLRDDIIYKP